MRSIVSKGASLSTLLNSCDKSFTSMLYFRDLCLALLFAKTNKFFRYSLVIRVAFYVLIGDLILNDFGVASFVKHFSKKIFFFFDTAALIFLGCNYLVVL